MGYYPEATNQQKDEIKRCVEKAQNLLGANKNVVKTVFRSIVRYQDTRDVYDPEWPFAPVDKFPKRGMGKVSLSVLEQAQDICKADYAGACDEKPQSCEKSVEPKRQTPRKPRIRSTDMLYQYVFDDNGGMSFNPCRILKMAPKKELSGGNWIAHPENNKITYVRITDFGTPMHFHVYEEDIDVRFASFNQYKTLVLSKQDDEKALDIYIEALGNRIEELEDQIGSFRDQIRMVEERKAGWTTES